ncbi:MAG: helix-turn-helix domain-containing protein [Bacteriovoracaceae bacterium]|nr:helix-turn-helix domain-containing protein [Bacteriovoracaceae bacterium]
MNKNVLKFVLSLKIRRLRQKKGLSLKDLSEMSGLSHSYLNEIEKGKKYPKVEKLLDLAKALDISIDELVSVKMGRELHPLLEFLESDLATSLPLSAFGIGEQDFYDLMSHSPEKFTSFLMTIAELAKSYDISLDDLNKAALRAYLEVNRNYFPYLEELASSFSRTLNKELKGLEFSKWYIYLEKKLKDKYHVRVDSNTLGVSEGTNGLRTLFKDENKLSGKVLFLNKNLDEKQRVHALVKELGAQQILSEDNLKKRDPLRKEFPELLLENQTLYFAGASLIPEESIVADLQDIFSKESFDQSDFLKLMEKYPAPPEVFMGRLTQVLPHHFDFNQMFFLCCNENIQQTPGSYYISQELHLGKLHHPHGVSLREHYCRRWITTELLSELVSENSEFAFGAQISQMEEAGKPYFCLSFARSRGSDPGVNSCFTLGLAMNENFREKAAFHRDDSIESRVVGRTCERCSLVDCKERVAPATMLQRIRLQEQKISAINKLIKL